MMESNWISVKDKLPPIDGNFGQVTIIIAVKGHKKWGSFVFPCFCSKARIGEGSEAQDIYSWYLPGYGEIEGNVPQECVTHWMPLPNSPNGGD